MNHQQLIDLGLTYPQTTLRYPFEPGLPVLYVQEKIFALLGSQQGVESINLKTSPDEAWLQRETYPLGVIPGYHMNKRHWNTVMLNGSVPEEIVVSMFQDSYRLVIMKMPKSTRSPFLPF